MSLRFLHRWTASARTGALAALAAAVLTIAPACASTYGRVYIRSGPPAPIVETRIGAPGPGYIWQPGFYNWTGREYAWSPGRWERAPRPRATWVPGRWAHDRRGWYFVEGHWR